jgi:hypothetical protein
MQRFAGRSVIGVATVAFVMTLTWWLAPPVLAAFLSNAAIALTFAHLLPYAVVGDQDGPDYRQAEASSATQ